jgi:hypothetical protein
LFKEVFVSVYCFCCSWVSSCRSRAFACFAISSLSPDSAGFLLSLPRALRNSFHAIPASLVFEASGPLVHA